MRQQNIRGHLRAPAVTGAFAHPLANGGNAKSWAVTQRIRASKLRNRELRAALVDANHEVIMASRPLKPPRPFSIPAPSGESE